jgi:hypothetical protein
MTQAVQVGDGFEITERIGLSILDQINVRRLLLHAQRFAAIDHDISTVYAPHTPITVDAKVMTGA